MSAARTRGFSLLEVLLASVLLAGGLLLAFASLRTVIEAQQRTEQRVAESERTRAVQQFLRRQIGGALPVAFEIVPETGEGRLLRLSEHKLEFVGAMPGYLSRGGLYLQTFEWVRAEGGWQLRFQAQQLTPDGPLDAERPPKVLISGMREARFEARAVDERGEWGGWEADWQRTAQLPPVLRLRAREQASGREWPVLVLLPRLAQTGITAPSSQLVPIDDGRRGDPE